MVSLSSVVSIQGFLQISQRNIFKQHYLLLSMVLVASTLINPSSSTFMYSLDVCGYDTVI